MGGVYVGNGTFGAALEAMRDGYRVARTGWNGKGMWIEIQVPDEHSKMRRPYIFMSPVDGDLVPWVASQSDMLADDWEVVGEGTGRRLGCDVAVCTTGEPASVFVNENDGDACFRIGICKVCAAVVGVADGQDMPEGAREKFEAHYR